MLGSIMMLCCGSHAYFHSAQQPDAEADASLSLVKAAASQRDAQLWQAMTGFTVFICCFAGPTRKHI